jgi:hypothetical protein
MKFKDISLRDPTNPALRTVNSGLLYEAEIDYSEGDVDMQPLGTLLF